MSEEGAGAPPNIPPENVEKKRNDYNRVVRQARLISIILDNVDFDIKPEAVAADKASIKRNISSDAQLVSFDSEDGSCFAKIVWKVDVHHNRKKIVKCKASYVVMYDNIKECPNEVVNIFVENVARPATYAFFRALYAHLDWSAGLASPPLPVVRYLPKV